MTGYEEIDTPALIVDLDTAEANIAEMAGVAARHGVRLRPHIKTHTMPEIGERLELVPNHVCPVSNLFDTAYGVRGGRLERELTVTARGKVR
ncbi:hypothetical protein [Actinomadura macra]|uniref:hypothetical protein n=1 Tax=Actinomadura macra TaxID=46164 RepID=UPI00082D011F|nr:hypothetical protein [Actinomadura macra]